MATCGTDVSAAAPPWCGPATQAALACAVQSIGTPCYVYVVDDIQRRIDEIARVFAGRFQISYAVKANPNRELLRWLQPRIPLLDVSSGGEFERALACGYDASRISFSGPGKTPAELAYALAQGGGKMIVESAAELADLDSLCERAGRRLPVLLRINPRAIPRGFGVNMSGRPCQFGVDEEDLHDLFETAARMRRVSITGLHIYAGTQCLDSGSIIENFANYIDIFRTWAPRCAAPLDNVIFGSGIGIPYHDRDGAVDLEALAATLNPMLDDMRRTDALAEATCVLEIGRLLVGEAGYYLARVLRCKHSRGKEIRIMDGGLNHHLAACGHFGSVIPRNYRMYRLPVNAFGATRTPGDKHVYELFGPLCTTIDQLGRGVEMDELDVGDIVAIASSGAYGASASPANFISHEQVRECIVETENGELTVRDVTPAA